MTYLYCGIRVRGLTAGGATFTPASLSQCEAPPQQQPWHSKVFCHNRFSCSSLSLLPTSHLVESQPARHTLPVQSSGRDGTILRRSFPKPTHLEYLFVACTDYDRYEIDKKTRIPTVATSHQDRQTTFAVTTLTAFEFSIRITITTGLRSLEAQSFRVC